MSMTKGKTNSVLSKTFIKGKEIIDAGKSKIETGIVVLLTALSLSGTMSSCGETARYEDGKLITKSEREKEKAEKSKQTDYVVEHPGEKPFDAKSEVEDLSKIQKNIQEFGVNAGKKLGKFSPGEKIIAENIDGKEVVEVSLGTRELFDHHMNSADRPVTTINLTNDINISIKDSGRTTKVRLCRRRQVVGRKLMLHMGFLVTVDGVQICDEVINVDNGEKFKDSETNKSYQYMKGLASKVVQLRGYIIHKECQKHKSELDQIRLKEDSIKIKEDSIQKAKLAKEKAAREYLYNLIKAKK